jgi:hypothetical protein
MIYSLEDYWFVILVIVLLVICAIIFVLTVFNIDTIFSWVMEQRKRYNRYKVHWLLKVVVLLCVGACFVYLLRILNMYVNW